MGKFTRFSTLILFTLLIAITSIALAETGTQKPFAYIEKAGMILKGTEIDEDAVSSEYKSYLDYYGYFDYLFEEPYVRAFVIDQLLKEKLEEYLSKSENLSLEAFQEKYSGVSEAEMQSYYEENRENIMKEAYVDFDYAVFETEDQAKKFLEKANEVGFQKALETIQDTSLVASDTYNGLKKSETGEAFIDILFGPYTSKLRLHTTENGSFVFFIKNSNDLSTFENFKESPMYASTRQNISNEKFNKYIDERIKNENIRFVVPQEYDIWLARVENIPAETIVEKYFNTVFDKDGNVIENNPWTISGMLMSIEDAKLTEKYSKEYGNAIKRLYDMGYKSFLVLARLRNYDDSESILLQYNIQLSEILLHYIEQNDIMSVLQYIYSNLSELETLSNSQNPEIRQKALEYLYKMNKALGDGESANKYLDQLRKENPDYKVPESEKEDN